MCVDAEISATPTSFVATVATVPRGGREGAPSDGAKSSGDGRGDDCRPSLLPVSIPLSGLSPETISGARNSVNYQPSEETGQSIMNMDTNEITINRIVSFVWDEEGTDVEDEMPTPVSSPTQIVVPAIPPAGTADPFGRGDGFDLEIAKVMCDVLPSLVSPLQEVEVPPCANAADYAAPAAPALETVLESPGYTVPEEWDVHGCRSSCRYQRWLVQTRGATCGRYRNRFRHWP